jgi:hypothetical protein
MDTATPRPFALPCRASLWLRAWPPRRSQSVEPCQRIREGGGRSPSLLGELPRPRGADGYGPK